MTPSPVEGLPEGVQFVGIRTPTENEYYMVNEPDGKGGHEMRIVQGQRAAEFASPTPHLTLPPNAAVIVKAAPGYKFRASIKTMSLWPVKVIEPPAKIEATVSFQVGDEFDQGKVNSALDNLKNTPGFVELKSGIIPSMEPTKPLDPHENPDPAPHDPKPDDGDGGGDGGTQPPPIPPNSGS